MTKALEGEVVDAPKAKAKEPKAAAKAKEPSRDVVAHEPTPMQMLGTMLTTPGVTPETLRDLMQLQREWRADQARMAFDEAMSEAKAQIPVIRKNRNVAFKAKDANKSDTNYDHEDLAEIARTVDPILSQHGLSYRFKTDAAPGQPITVTCIIAHRLGHSEQVSMTAPHDASGNKNPIQAIGSAVTYLQRYTLKAALGLAAAMDDDGQSSGDGAEAARLSMDQYDEIMALVKATDTPPNMAAFLKMFKAESVSDIRGNDFAAAKKALEDRNAKVLAKAKAPDQGKLV